jgi:hypothetical protein
MYRESRNVYVSYPRLYSRSNPPYIRLAFSVLVYYIDVCGFIIRSNNKIGNVIPRHSAQLIGECQVLVSK